MKVTCPKCGKETDYLADDPFCEHCYEHLEPPQKTPQNTSMTSEQDEPTRRGNQVDFSEKKPVAQNKSLPKDNPNEQHSQMDLLDRQLRKETAVLEKEMKKANLHENSRNAIHDDMPLCVESLSNLPMISGSEAVLKLRLTMQPGHRADVVVFLADASNQPPREVAWAENLESRSPREIFIPYSPGAKTGVIILKFNLVCLETIGRHQFTFSETHLVYEAGGSFANAMPQYAPIIKVNADGVADVAVNGYGAGQALEELARRAYNFNEQLERLLGQKMTYERQWLTETSWLPYQSDRLMLEYDSFCILLLTGQTVRLGRSSEKSDLLVRNGQGKIPWNKNGNDTVSRLHAEIHKDGTQVTLIDRSSYGTFINGKKIASEGIAVEGSSLVEFGDIHWRMNLQRCQRHGSQLICRHCEDSEPKSLIFKRTDNEPEGYAIVWNCCDLSQLLPSLKSWTVFSRDGVFYVRRPDQTCSYLMPGGIVSCGNQTLRCSDLEQIWIEKKL